MTESIRKLVIISKSRWEPSLRREHALARLAADHGYSVTFVEAPIDIRALKRSPFRWGSSFAGRSGFESPEGIHVIRRSCLVPSHRNVGAETADRLHLRWLVSRELGDERASIVLTLPWHFAAIPRRPGDRLILDVADDWAALVPSRAGRIRELYQSAAQGVDEIVLVSESLRPLFGGAHPHVIRNAVDVRVLGVGTPVASVRGRLVYVGTLSERFDAGLLGEMLERLPDWTVELYGSCAYAGHGSDPGSDLEALLIASRGRVTWHGPIDRRETPRILDSAEILILPNRGDRSRGQDSMKIYDYAARGRPILATSAAVHGISELPPHTYVGDTADDLSRLVDSVRGEPASFSDERRHWAAGQTWEVRWPAWEKLIVGAERLADSEEDPKNPLLGSRAHSRHHVAFAGVAPNPKEQSILNPDAERLK
jgi:hypothetical protein